MPWRSWLNAEIYDRFVRERRIYDRLNRRMVELAELADARRVLDLGCGTGATAEACLRRLDPAAELVGVDASEEMVGVAQSNVSDPRARFEVCAAAEIERLEGRFDRAVCNAAFWQFPAIGPVFAALAARTEPGALFVLNVPAERVTGESTTVHPFQIALMNEIESTTGTRLDATPTLLDPERLRLRAREHDFEPVTRERFVYEGVQGELMELMTIPAMIRPLMPEADDETREAAVRRAAERSDPTLRVEVPWVYFSFRRGQESPSTP